MKRKFTVDIGGQQQEVEVEITDQILGELLTNEVLQTRGLMTRQQVGDAYLPKDSFEAELKRRVDGIVGNGYVKLDSLKEEGDARQKVLDLLGVKIAPDGKPQLTADQVATLQEEWRNKELEPVTQRAKKAEDSVASLLDRILDGEILQAAAQANVQKHFLRPVAEGQRPPIVTMVRDLFGYDAEHGRHFRRKGDGFDFSSDPKTTGVPYKTVSEFLVKDWATQKENSPFIDAKAPGGANLNQPGGGPGGSVTINAPSDGGPMSLQDYQQAQKSAGDGGSVVVNTPGV